MFSHPPPFLIKEYSLSLMRKQKWKLYRFLFREGREGTAAGAGKRHVREWRGQVLKLLVWAGCLQWQWREEPWCVKGLGRHQTNSHFWQMTRWVRRSD